MYEANDDMYLSLIGEVKNVAKEVVYEFAVTFAACLNEQIQKMGMEITSGKSRFYDPDTASEHEGNLMLSFSEIFFAAVVESDEGWTVEVIPPENMTMTDPVCNALEIAFSNAIKILEISGGDSVYAE